MSSKSDPIAETTNWKTATFGLLIAGLGAVGTRFAVDLTDGWLKLTVLAFTSTLISTGSLALVFELLLRRNVFREMYRLSGLNEELSTQHLAGGGKVSDLAWKDVFRSRSKVEMIFRDPLPWVENNISYLFDEMQLRPVKVKIYLPDPEAAYVADLAETLEVDLSHFKGSVDRAIQRVERTWDDLFDRSAIKKGSLLEIRILHSPPLYNLAVCDGLSIVQICGPLGKSRIDPDYYYMHSGQEDQFPLSLHASQMDGLKSSLTLFKEAK